ncbi:MAG: YciI family protein [Alphaproteobacteria bacterium]|nr:YciI family protein [Alphaproteobacteria bacterium]
MPKFVFAYHGGKMPESPEEGAKVMAAWGAWFEELGDAVVDGGGPVGESRTVTAAGVSDGGGANPLSGYSVVNAENAEAAVAMAKGCPILDAGSVEVSEVLDM